MRSWSVERKDRGSSFVDDVGEGRDVGAERVKELVSFVLRVLSGAGIVPPGVPVMVLCPMGGPGPEPVRQGGGEAVVFRAREVEVRT